MKRLLFACAVLSVAAAVTSCSGGGGGGASAPVSVPVTTNPPTSTPTASPTPVSAPTVAPAAVPAKLTVQGGFYAQIVARIPQARQMAALPNGDLLVGTLASTVYLIPGAENAGGAQAPVVFATVPDTKAHSVAYSPDAGAIFIATTNHVYKVPYKSGDRVASAVPASILSVRTGNIAPNSDGDVHTTTSLAVSKTTLYVSVGSSCNSCAEVDPTRAAILSTDFNGGSVVHVATRVRNAIALGVNPASQHLWIGGAGQDCLPQGTTTCGSQNDAYFNGRPFDWVDDLSAHATPVVDYMWPLCEENRRDQHSFNAVWPTSDCSSAPIPLIEFPTYSTHIGLTMYPQSQTGAYAFPAAYRGLYVTSHGSWHESASGVAIAQPDLAYVRMNGDTPATSVNFTNPGAQWNSFFGNFQDAFGSRVGQPTGVTVGASGSLFVADDNAGVVYRLRPGLAPASVNRRSR